jgi:hypothetical protein
MSNANTTSALATTILADTTKEGRLLARPLERANSALQNLRADLAVMGPDPSRSAGTWLGWDISRNYYYNKLTKEHYVKQVESEYETESLFLVWAGPLVEKEVLRKETRRQMLELKDSVVKGKKWHEGVEEGGDGRWREMKVEEALGQKAFRRTRRARRKFGPKAWELA